MPHPSKKTLAAWLSVLAVLALAAAMLGPSPHASAQGGVRPELRRALLATVRLAVPIDAEKDMYSTGSGTILNEDGTILTNYHVVGDIDREEMYNSNGLVFVAINPTNLKGLPTWKYEAEVQRADPEMDLALIKITGLMESDDPLPASLGLISIELANSDEVSIGDEVDVIGFPGIGGDTVTYTEGSVSGFLDEDNNDVFEWIKTDAEVNHGNSGGLAINADGLMIGVPTAGVSDAEAAGKISLIRPINLAESLIKLGSAPVQSSTSSTCRDAEEHPKGAAISNLVFAESVDRNNKPGGVAAQFDSGIKTVYAVFNYDRFKNGRDFHFTWYLDDEQVLDETAEWDGGARGVQWVNVYNDPNLPDGLYTLELHYDDVLLACGNFTVGEQKAVTMGAAKIGAFTFASEQQNDEPVDARVSFPSGTTDIYAFFDYSGMKDGVEWRQVWTIDGEAGLDSTDVWGGGEAGNYWISVNSDPLPDGDYELKFYVDGNLAQSGQFSIGGGGSSGLSTQDGIVVTGVVTDANRKSRTIADAMIIFLVPGTDVDEWADTQDEASVHAVGVSDEDGVFQLSDTVIVGETYPVIVIADQYRPIVEEAYTIPEDATSPYELDVSMVRE